MNKYSLTVRGETIAIEFKRVNDSRRLCKFSTDTQKKPNLFGIRGAMLCTAKIPQALCPKWLVESETYKKSPHDYTARGVGFCHRSDEWNSQKGRHKALAEALNYYGHDDQLNAEIVTAFTAEEKARTKVKGPARIPKTAKPKQRKPKLAKDLRQELDEIKGMLEKLLHPPGFFVPAGLSDEDLDKLINAKPGELVPVPPTNTATPTPTPFEHNETAKENA